MYTLIRPRQSKLNKVLRIKVAEFRLGLSARLIGVIMPSKEIWKTIPFLPFYDASTKGRIRSWKNNKWGRLSKPRILKICVNKKLKYRLLNTRQKSYLVHRLILMTFVGPPPSNHECLHWDDDKLNNNLENLRWGTHKENAADWARNGRMPKGSTSYKAILTEKDIPEIRELCKWGFPHHVIGTAYGVSRGAIWSIYSGDNWSHVT